MPEALEPLMRSMSSTYQSAYICVIECGGQEGKGSILTRVLEERAYVVNFEVGSSQLAVIPKISNLQA